MNPRDLNPDRRPEPPATPAEPTPVRLARLALLAGLVCAAAGKAQAQYGGENWPKHDGGASEYHYPPPPPAPPPPPGSPAPPPGAPKPECSQCHGGLPSAPPLPPPDNTFPATLLRDAPRFARVHAMAATRAPNRATYSRLLAEDRVAAEFKPLYRAIKAR